MVDFEIDRFGALNAECERLSSFEASDFGRSGIKSTFKRFNMSSASRILKVRRFRLRIELVFEFESRI